MRMNGLMFSATDHTHMAHALRLAARGLYTTAPNPRVGCVIAEGDTVLGTGFHQRAGEPHAEVFALREAGTTVMAGSEIGSVTAALLAAAQADATLGEMQSVLFDVFGRNK